jgi:hypothetical protein
MGFKKGAKMIEKTLHLTQAIPSVVCGGITFFAQSASSGMVERLGTAGVVAGLSLFALKYIFGLYLKSKNEIEKIKDERIADLKEQIKNMKTENEND